MIEEFIRLVDPAILHRPGAVFYSGPSAFSQPSDLYILGINPGGGECGTIAENIASTLKGAQDWSAYEDLDWEGNVMRLRVLYLLDQLGRKSSQVPASNAIFVRTRRAEHLSGEGAYLRRVCWQFHEAVIERLGVRTVLCFGKATGRQVRDKLQAHERIAAFQENNGRRWTSEAHRADDDRCVITLTHPSIAKWNVSATDPSEMVRAVIARQG